MQEVTNDLLRTLANEISRGCRLPMPFLLEGCTGREVVYWLKTNDRNGDYDGCEDIAWECLEVVLEDEIEAHFGN